MTNAIGWPETLFKEDIRAKLTRRAEPSEYSSDELESILDALANHYSTLNDIWQDYFEAILAFSQKSTES